MKQNNKVLVLRTCAADLTSHGGYRWPESGPVEAPDWDPWPVCGHGLHGLLRGAGDGGLLDWSAEATWLVVEVDADDIVDLDGKCKFRRGVVVHCGDRLSATKYLVERGADPARVVGYIATAGDGGIATAGNYGIATAGIWGTATAGNRGIVVVHYWDERTRRMRLAVGYVGEDGIEPDQPYRVEGGKLVPADDEAQEEE